MFRTLLRKELLVNLLNLRLAVALILTVVLGPLTAYVGGLEYSRRMEAYRAEVKQIQSGLDRARIYQDVQPDFVAPPEPLSVFALGVDKSAGQRMYIRIGYVPAGASGVGDARNPLMKAFAPLDFTSVVFLLLSFLAVVLGFDGVCGERQAGTLQLVLANPVPRATVILAKLAGGILTLCVPLALAFILSLLLLSANPDVALRGEHWVRLVVYFAVSALFLAQVYSLSLLVSAWVRRPSISLVICLFAWLVSGVGYANLLPAVVRYSTYEPYYQIYLDQRQHEYELQEEETKRWQVNNPEPEGIYQFGMWENGRLRFGHPRYHQWLQRWFAYKIELDNEVAQRVGEFQRANFAPLGDEARLVDRWTILSPFTSYRVLAKQLMRTTLDDNDLMREAAYRYRATFLSWLRGRNAFGSRRWYSDDPDGQEPLVPAPETLDPALLAPGSPYLQQRQAWAREEGRLADADLSRRLDLSSMPKFGDDWRRTLGQSLTAMGPGLATLLLTLGIGVTGSVVLFIRSDVV